MGLEIYNSHRFDNIIFLSRDGVNLTILIKQLIPEDQVKAAAEDDEIWDDEFLFREVSKYFNSLTVSE